MANNPWHTLETRVVYENRWFSVREDHVVRPDGSPGIYGVVQLPESVGIVALDGDRVALVSQWRYVHNKESLEIPTGARDAQDESLLAAAQRELLEETGLEAREWRELGAIDNSNGATTDVAHVFRAQELSAVAERPTLPAESTQLNWVSFFDAVEMALDGRITESTSVAALLKVAFLRHIDSAPGYAGTA